ncbi:MAG: hypothetical protein OEY64_08300 [Nitrospinota bacterium]|nr:hypothetical protein [Nitrospinota bacterium]
MFFGNYPGTLDEKGRVHIPSILGKELGDDDQMVVARWGECLAAFPMPFFEEMAKSLREEAKLSKDPAKVRKARNIFAGSFAGTFKSGKLLIPQEIRTTFELEKKLQIVGMDNKIEIWNQSTWLEQEAPEDGSSLRDDLDEFGLL